MKKLAAVLLCALALPALAAGSLTLEVRAKLRARAERRSASSPVEQNPGLQGEK